MGLFDSWEFQLPFRRRPSQALTGPVVLDGPDLVAELENRRSHVLLSTVPTLTPKTESITLGGAMSLDSDDYQYRRLTSGQKVHRRDLSPLAQDRMLEIAWFLFEGNPFAKRLINLMKDLCLGEGLGVVTQDDRIQEVIDKTWAHPINQLATRVGEFFISEELNGELILPCAVNPIDGRLTLGFIEPYQVQDIIPLDGNALIADTVLLKPERGEKEGKQFKIIRFNPESGLMEGEVFYHGINKLPNSLRGRSSLMALADWLDLYDQYMFAEVERLHILSAYVWDYTIEGAQSDTEIAAKVAKLPKPKPGLVFGHNEKEKLEPKTPDLKATDRSEVARLLRIHIAGSYGFPLSYLGDIDSNRATIEGQNDVLLKTPAARQKDFASFLNQVIGFGVQSALKKNPALFKDANATWKITMPEIQAKDIARVGAVLASVASALDTSLANETMSRKAAMAIQVSIVKHLGVDISERDLEEQIEQDREQKQDRADQMQAQLAQRGLPGPGGRRNPPVPDDDEPPRRTPPDDDDDDLRESLDDLVSRMDALADRPQPPVNVQVHPAAVNVSVPVATPDVKVENTVHLPKGGKVIKETVHQRTAAGLLDKSITTETPAD